MRTPDGLRDLAREMESNISNAESDLSTLSRTVAESMSRGSYRAKGEMQSQSGMKVSISRAREREGERPDMLAGQDLQIHLVFHFPPLSVRHHTVQDIQTCYRWRSRAEDETSGVYCACKGLCVAVAEASVAALSSVFGTDG